MEESSLREILERLRIGSIGVDQAVEILRTLPYEDLEFAKVDHHRHLRTGFPEVVFCQGKTIQQVLAILDRLARVNSRVMATRAGPELYEAARALWPHAAYREAARVIVLEKPGVKTPKRVGRVVVASGGTADIPVAEEAAVTAEVMGAEVERVYDVGVAGLHRLLDKRKVLTAGRVIVAVAGMEGALASVVAGLVDKPVIAVPTSVGYGASFGGLAALLAMLNSCAAGVGVVNIDNGFGAGYLAAQINRLGGEVI
ncbi:MAG TPA: nickel pincer cofactor biosynthesis protein LarB [Bacillota bacterium]